jgi:hypothetical protein
VTPEIRPQFHPSPIETAMNQSRSFRLFTVFVLAVEVALTWALVHPAIRSFGPSDDAPIYTEIECTAATTSTESRSPRSFS